MATKKPSKKKINARDTAIQPPLGPDQFVKLNNEEAKKPMPKKLSDQLKRYEVTINVNDKGYDLEKGLKRTRKSGSWQLELPAGSNLVTPGRKYGKVDPKDVIKKTKGKASAIKALSEPFRPTWMDYTPHPKISTDAKPLLKRINGSKVEPHYGVFGADDRQVYYPSGYPWICIGKILVWDDFSQPFPAWSGSGVLIGGRVVLTCGHMAPWGSNNWAMQFIPAFYDGGSTLGSSVSSWVSDYWGYNTNNQVSAWDMLVLRLYTPLGNTYGYFGTKDYNSSWEGGNYWTLAGYPGAIAGGNRPSRQMWWPVLDDDQDGGAEEVEYEADSSPGNSGGPVFGFWNGLPYAIATHSGGSKTTFLWWTLEDTNVGAGGGALNSLVAWARSNWP